MLNLRLRIENLEQAFGKEVMCKDGIVRELVREKIGLGRVEWKWLGWDECGKEYRWEKDEGPTSEALDKFIGGKVVE